jgi:hypothetical protein
MQPDMGSLFAILPFGLQSEALFTFCPSDEKAWRGLRIFLSF